MQAQALLQKAEYLIAVTIVKVYEETGITIPFPRITINNRMTQTLGLAEYHQDERDQNNQGYCVQFSGKRFAGLEQSSAFADTVFHEIAHIADHFINGKFNDHNQKWKYFANMIGAMPNASASQKNSDALNKSGHLYVCPACNNQIHISTQRHNNIQKRGALFCCNRCNTNKPIQYAGQ